MLNVLIVESDPIIAMDLRDSVFARDRSARVTLHARSLPDAERDLTALQGFSHAFLRMSSRAHHGSAERVARRLSADGTCVVLHGAEALPPPLSDSATVTVMPFPFSAQDVLCRLAAGRGRCFSPQSA